MYAGNKGRARSVAGLLVLQSGEDIVIGIRSIIQLVRLVQARGIIDTVAEHDVEYVLILLRQIVREVDIVGKVLVLVVKPLLHTMYRLIFQHICLVYIRICFLKLRADKL